MERRTCGEGGGHRRESSYPGMYVYITCEESRLAPNEKRCKCDILYCYEIAVICFQWNFHSGVGSRSIGPSISILRGMEEYPPLAGRYNPESPLNKEGARKPTTQCNLCTLYQNCRFQGYISTPPPLAFRGSVRPILSASLRLLFSHEARNQSLRLYIIRSRNGEHRPADTQAGRLRFELELERYVIRERSTFPLSSAKLFAIDRLYVWNQRNTVWEFTKRGILGCEKTYLNVAMYCLMFSFMKLC